MKVVLLQDVKKLGKRGDVIEVSSGYGRNVLIRQGLAVEGTKANLNTAHQRQESKEFKSQVAADEAEIMASQLKKVKLVKCRQGKTEEYSAALPPVIFLKPLNSSTSSTSIRRRLCWISQSRLWVNMM